MTDVLSPDVLSQDVLSVNQFFLPKEGLEGGDVEAMASCCGVFSVELPASSRLALGLIMIIISLRFSRKNDYKR